VPLHSNRFQRGTLLVDGQRYDLTNVYVTDQSVEQEFNEVRGARGPVGRTRGRVTERISFEAELAGPIVGVLTNGNVTGTPIGAVGPTGAQGPIGATGAAAPIGMFTGRELTEVSAIPYYGTFALPAIELEGRLPDLMADALEQAAQAQLESDSSFRERIVRVINSQRDPEWGVLPEALGADLDRIASVYGLERSTGAEPKSITQVPLKMNIEPTPTKKKPKSAWDRLLEDDLLC
jgi:hypothetical protein